jgi:hypothetical protein
VCSHLERNVSITTQLLREKAGGGPLWNRHVGPFLHGAARYPATWVEVQHPVAPKKATPRGVIDSVASNPGSPAGDVARTLGLNRNSVATRLAQLARSGELTKAKRGYAAPNCAWLVEARR